jgi:hypothetical protein
LTRLLVGAVLTLTLAGGAESRPLAPPPVTGWLTYGASVTRTGETSARLAPATLRSSWFADVDGMVTTQPLVARNVPTAGQTTIYFGVSSGLFEAVAPNGYVRWSAHLGVIPHSCPQLPTWGVTGTPVIDASVRAIFVADAFGWLHSFDLATGKERGGWPVQLYADPERELVWGALADVGGAIYAATGSYCDQAMEGKVVRIDLASRRRSVWTSVPASRGGGGGIWGWGGVAYSASAGRLYVATGNAFEGGSNRGSSFTEAAGYGEQLVALNENLDVVAASHPPDVPNGLDSDFVGSPVVVRPDGCGEVVAVLNKDGLLYFWHGDDIAAGVFATAVVQAPDFDHPLLGNPAYDTALRSFYVVTFSRLVRITIGGDCMPAVSWRRALGQSTLNSSATVADDVVWFALSGPRSALVAYDGRTGKLLLRRRIGGMSFAAPTVVDGRLFEDARHGFTTPGARRSAPTAAANLAGWIDRQHGWLGHEKGVYATDDGRHWRRIFAGPAARIIRTSVTDGVISVGTHPAACNCTARRLWTRDGGHTWRATAEIGANFSGRGNTLVWWRGGKLEQITPWPSQSWTLRSRPIATFSRPIVDTEAIPGGVAVLLTSAGHGWDETPLLYLIRGGQKQALALPPAKGKVLVTDLDVSWPTVAVKGVGVDGSIPVARWRSTDAGRRWSVKQTRR